MPTTLKAVGSIALVTALLGVAACGDDDGTTSSTAAETSTESTTSTDTSASTGGGGDTIPVSLTDFAIDPPDPTVSAGTVTFDVSNDGETVHNLEVEGPDGEAELEADLEPGDSGSLDVDLSKPGTYEWYCPVGNHRDLGMEGEITVQ